MNRGPRTGAQRVDFVAKARAAWGSPPDWILTLAGACNQSSATAVAKQLDYSPSVVSQVLAGTYAGDLDRVADMVRGRFLAATVLCPEKGTMGRDVCLGWQDKPYAATSSDRVRMFHACRRCPLSKFTKEIPDAA